jgi:hypothetical protein
MISYKLAYEIYKSRTLQHDGCGLIGVFHELLYWGSLKAPETYRVSQKNVYTL